MTLTTALRQAVSEALTEHALTAAPLCVHELAPPNDVHSEELIVSALLSGRVTLTLIAPLRARDFFLPLHRGIVSVLETAPTADVARVVLGLEALGFVGPLLGDVLLLRDGVRDCVDVFWHVGTVRELSRRRRLVAWLRRLEAEVVTGSVTATEAMDRMRAVTAGRG